MKIRVISSILLSSLSLQSACIHTDAEERVSIEILELDKLNERGKENGKEDLQIEHLIYSPAKLPLEDFFERLSAGEFKASFQRINLLYTPATSDDEVLQKLLDVGIIPVYVRMKNSGGKPYKFSESDFTLDDGSHKLDAITADQLPRTLQKFHVGALGANIFNTGVVVIAVAGIMAVLVLASHGNSGGFDALGGTRSSDTTATPTTKVYNETTKTTYLDYKNYLLSAQTIAPGEVGQGLLFFRASNDFDRGNIRFGFKRSVEVGEKPIGE